MFSHIRNEKSRLTGTRFAQPACRQESHYVPIVEIFISRTMYFPIIYACEIKSIHQPAYVHYLWKTIEYTHKKKPPQKRGFR